MSRPNTFLKAEPRLIFVWLFLTVFALSGCGPKYTYPSAQVPSAIESICQKEYGITTQARVVGKTVGAMLYVDNLLDAKGQIAREVHEQMGKAMQVVTRVALSTDLPLDFCTVVVRDRKTNNELIITRSLDDTKRANADAIGIEESINRTIFGQGRYGPHGASNETFVLKEVTLESFLADQIAQRIRFSLTKDTKDDASQPFLLVDGSFDRSSNRRVFRFSVLALKAEGPKETMIGILRIVNEVLGGYRFRAFDRIEVQDYLNRQKLSVDQSTFLRYQDKQISDDELLEQCLTESQTIQEAFKLFGFNLPKDSEEKALAPAAAPSH